MSTGAAAAPTAPVKGSTTADRANYYVTAAINLREATFTPSRTSRRWRSAGTRKWSCSSSRLRCALTGTPWPISTLVFALTRKNQNSGVKMWLRTAEW